MVPEFKQIGILITDANLAVKSWDLWLVNSTGISEEAARGRLITELIPDLEKRGLLLRFQRVLAEGSTEMLAPAFHHYLFPCPPQSPSEHFDKMQQRVTIAPLREGDQIVGTIVTIEDVTARLDKERSLAIQLKSSDERERLKAAQALASEESPESARKLIDTLKDESRLVRKAAVDGLASRNDSEIVTALLRTLRNEHRNPSVLNSVLQVLSMSGLDTISPLIELLEDPEADLRIYVALALGEQRDPRAIPVLMKVLKDRDINVRCQAIESLGKLQAAEAVDELASIAESGDFYLAFPAIDALMNIGDPGVAPKLVPLLEDQFLRTTVAETLSILGDEEVVAPLVALLNKPGSSAKTIARSLAILHSRYQRLFQEATHIEDLVRKNIKPTGVQNLLDALDEAEENELPSLALVLGWLDGPAVEKALTQLLGRQMARKEVVEALVRHGSRVVDLLIEQLDSEDLETRQAAVIALGRIGHSSAVPTLVKLLSKDEELVIVLAGALAKIGDRYAFDALLEMIGHPDAAVRQAVVAALNSLGHPDMPKRVAELLRNGSPLVRESAVKIAGYFGYTEYIDLILDCCRDTEEKVRRAAIESLPFLEDERVVPALVEALKNGTPRIRATAAQAFAQVDGPNAFPHLLSALKDQDPWVRYFAARSLGQQGYPDALDALARVAQSDSASQVRIAAMEALGKIGGSRVVRILAPLAESGDRDMERVALTALGQVSHPDALPPLLAALRSQESARRIDALNALGKRGGPGSAGALQWVGAVDTDPAVIKAAIDALATLETIESIAALVALTADPTRREACVSALSHMGEQHIETIAKGLSHAQVGVRIAVIDALARMKRSYASELLSVALDDPEASVRLAVIKALTDLGSYYAERKIAILAKTDPDLAVRNAAQKALRR